MRQSKSLGSLALWSDRSRNTCKSHLADTAAAAAEEQWPTCADQYEILDDCGRGVSAVVYKAHCLSNGKVVAIKALNLEALMSPLEDIMHEAQTMKACKNDAVLQLYCSFVTGEELWMVMPYMEGGSMAHIMRYRYPDGLQEVIIATIMRKVLEALAYVHKQGDIHRDVKAGNVLVDAAGNVKLGDFGVAATLERESDWGHTKPRLTFVGTPCWMAPEVLEQVAGYGTSADIWSFGITMLELAHGHAPFSKLPPMKVLLMTLQGPPPQLEATCGGRHFSRGMREVVARCLNKDPSKRPTAKELLEHRFFKQAKDAEFLRRTLLAGLPPLPQRCNEIRAGKAATGARENERAAVASHISYITDVAQWDFNCLKGIEAGLVTDSQASNRPNSGKERDQQPPIHLQQHPSLYVPTAGTAAGEAPAAAEVVRLLSGDVATAAAGPDQQQKGTGEQGPAVKETPAFTRGGGMPTSPHAGGSVSPCAAAAADSADAMTTAAAPQSPRLAAYCFSGGKQVASFPLSTPGSPGRSPCSSRPATPEAFAAAAAADGHAAASALTSIKTSDSRPGTTGSGMSAKRHGRFTIIEGSQPYEGPEITGSPGSGVAPPLSPMARQRSISTPDIGALGALKLVDDRLVLPAAAKTAAAVQQSVQPAATAAALHDAVPSPAEDTSRAVDNAAGSTIPKAVDSTTTVGSTSSSTTGSPSRAGLLSRFLAERALKGQNTLAKQQQQQQLRVSPQRSSGLSPRGERQQQPLNFPLLKRHHRESSTGADACSSWNGSAASVDSSSSTSSLQTAGLARPGASLSDIYSNTTSGTSDAASAQCSPSIQQQQQQQAPCLSRPAAALGDVYPASLQQQQQHHHHTAADMWGHVKDVCSEAVAHVAQPFRTAAAAAAHHSSLRQRSPDPLYQQQQYVLRHESVEGAANALTNRDSYSSAGSANALRTVNTTGGSSSSSSSKPPRYQQACAGTLRAQQQQGAGAVEGAAAASASAATDAKHRKNVSFIGLDEEAPAVPAAAAATTLLETVPLVPAAHTAKSVVEAEPAVQVAESAVAQVSMPAAEHQQQQDIAAAAAGPELKVRQQQLAAQSAETNTQVLHNLSISQQLVGTHDAGAAATVRGMSAASESSPTFLDGSSSNRVESQPPAGATSLSLAPTVGNSGSSSSSSVQQPAAVQAAAAAPLTPSKSSMDSREQQQHGSTITAHRPEVTLVMHSPRESQPAAAAAAAAADGTPVKRHRGRFTITET